jgi:hypothetical protein
MSLVDVKNRKSLWATPVGSQADILVRNSYIRDLITGEYLIFQFFPEEVSESVTANYTTTEIIGRSHPIYGYSGSSGRSFSLDLKFMDFGDKDKYDVDYYCRWLQSLCYPDYVENGPSGFIKPPHAVKVRMGNFLYRKCIVDSVTVKRVGPWDVEKGLPIMAEVNISFKEIGIVPYSCEEIKLTSSQLWKAYYDNT